MTPRPNCKIVLGDLGGDGIVGITDFMDLLAAWGPCQDACCLADLDLDGLVGITDFMIVLGNWGRPGGWLAPVPDALEPA